MKDELVMRVRLGRVYTWALHDIIFIDGVAWRLVNIHGVKHPEPFSCELRFERVSDAEKEAG